MRDDSNSPHEAPAAGRGFFPTCKVEVSGRTVHVLLCRTERPSPCPYCIPFGHDHVCHHPNFKPLVEEARIEALKQAPPGPRDSEPSFPPASDGGSNAAPDMEVSLEVEDTLYTLETELITIGRSPENAIQVPDGSVSWHHAELIRTPEGFQVSDLDSRNGTSINGRRITGKTLLHDGDLLRFGSSEAFKYACHSTQ